MVYVAVSLFVVGVLLLVVGYRKNHRNLLLTAAIVLFISATIGPFSQGFVEGLNGGWANGSSAARK